MAEVPAGFPTKLTDEELAESIEVWSAEYRHRWPQSTLPELVVAFINTASQEQLRRQAMEAARSADRTANRALYVAFAALAVSLLSLITSLVNQ